MSGETPVPIVDHNLFLRSQLQVPVVAESLKRDDPFIAGYCEDAIENMLEIGKSLSTADRIFQMSTMSQMFHAASFNLGDSNLTGYLETLRAARNRGASDDNLALYINILELMCAFDESYEVNHPYPSKLPRRIYLITKYDLGDLRDEIIFESPKKDR